MSNQYNWRKRLLTAIVLVVISGTLNCSWVIRARIPKAEIGETGWAEGGYCGARIVTKVKYYSFRHEGVTLSICPDFYGGRAIFWGPPYLPILPNFFALSTSEYEKRERFKITITMQSSNNVAMIDLSKIRIRLSGRDPLQPIDAKKRGKAELPLKTPLQEIIIPQEHVDYDLTYDISPVEVRKLVIDIGNLQIDGKIIEVPELRYEEDTQYHYLPIHYD